MEEYSVYSKFDLEKHKQTYKNYLEVIITADGEIMYAVPSHQEKAIQLACETRGITRDELNAMCPREYYCDFLPWVLSMCDCLAVWTDGYVAWDDDIVTLAQYARLRSLKLNGVYRGALPKRYVTR